MQPQTEREALLSVFAAESDENLAALETALAALVQQPSRRDVLDAAFRAAHSLKGSATIVGFAGVADLAHHVEDALQHLREGRLPAETGLLPVLQQASKRLSQLVQFALHRGAAVPYGCASCLAGLVGRSETAEGAPAGDLAAGPQAAQPTRTLRVPLQRLDRLLDVAGELALAQADLRHALEEAGVGSGGRAAMARLERLHAQLQEQVMGTRLVPIGPAFQRQAVAVRELAAAHGKLVRLVLRGGDVEIDTALVERLFDPLTHLLRNAVDHGIETPDERRAAGKDPCGCITLVAHHEAGEVVIEVADDGAGMDLAALRRSAHAQGLERGGHGAHAWALAFEPGVSTAREVTELSGRGVGLDVVRRALESLRGSIAVDTRPGAGTTFKLRLPLTLAIIEGFGVAVGDESYVVPLDNVLECVDLPASLAGRDEAAGVLELRGTPLPFVRLRALFGVAGTPPAREQVVVLRHAGGCAGLVVDGLLGASQTVVKPLAGLLRDVPGIAGTAILGAGRVALTLDPGRLIDEVRARVEAQARSRETAEIGQRN